MAYISNTTKDTGTSGILSKYGGSTISAPGSKINQPAQNPVVWGIPQAQNNGLPTPSFNTANSTPSTTQAPGPITRSSTPYNPGTSTPQPAGGLIPATQGNQGNGGTSQQSALLGQVQDRLKQLVAERDAGKSSNTSNSSSKTNTSRGVRGVMDVPKSSQFNQATSGLINKSDPNKAQRDYLRKLEEQSRKGEEIGRRAGEISERYGGEIARVGKLGAGAVAGARSTGTDVVGRGNANLAAESASNRISSLSAAQAAELQGTQQQLTGAEQGLTGLNNALLGANTQQAQGIQALGQAGQLSMPSPAQYGQTVFDPTTGSYTAGGNMDPQVQAGNFAQNVMNGSMTYDQALASLGYAGQAGTNFLNNAIAQAGGNPLQLQAQGAASQANIATQNTAGTDIARQGLQTATQDYIGMTTAAEFAHTQAKAVSDILAQTGLNNISSQDYNKGLNNLKGRFSDVNFQSLNTALIEAQSAYTSLLSASGGTPSGREAQAIGTLDINSSAAAINASIQELENAVSRRLQAQYGALQQYNTNLGTGATTGGGGGDFAEAW